MYLSEKFDTSLMVALWEGARTTTSDIFTTLEDTLGARYGWTADSAFADFAVWNYITNTRDDGSHYGEGVDYPLISIDLTHTLYPFFARTPPHSPSGYAASYIEFLPGNASGPLDLTFDGGDNTQWAAFLVKSSDPNTHQVEKIPLDSLTQSATVEIPDLASWYTVALVAVNLNEFGDPATYTYSLTAPSPYAVASTVLTDTLIYSGATRQFAYQVSNPSAVGEVYDVYGWDDSGWVATDTTDIFLNPGDSTTVLIPVTPPVGTPLGAHSNLHFRADSRSDSLVSDEQVTYAVTVVQHGDVNFDGAVDIADLTSLIDHLFINFPPLTVPEAGNVNCQGVVDISDLTALIDWLFINFTPSPCNPF